MLLPNLWRGLNASQGRRSHTISILEKYEQIWHELQQNDQIALAHANCQDREVTTGRILDETVYVQPFRMQPGIKTNLVRISFTVVADILWTRLPSSGCIYPSQTLLFPQGANTALSLGSPSREKHTGQSGGLTLQFQYNYISELKK